LKPKKIDIVTFVS